MKFVKLKLKNGEWDARYTQELQGYVSNWPIHSLLLWYRLSHDISFQISHDQFMSTVYLLNGAIARAAPPLLKLKWWRAGIVSIWFLVAAISAVIWYYTGFTMIIALEPAIMIFSSMLYMMVFHRQTNAFELAVEDICDRLNATENVRGVRYAFHTSRLSRGSSVLQWLGGSTASYVSYYSRAIFILSTIY